jgi:hypothetical protein
MKRLLVFFLLAVVAAAAAVLSFSALRDLALRCGFAPELAWLLPVVLDAGAAAGSAAWLSARGIEAGRFGRRSRSACSCSPWSATRSATGCRRSPSWPRGGSWWPSPRSIRPCWPLCCTWRSSRCGGAQRPLSWP